MRRLGEAANVQISDMGGGGGVLVYRTIMAAFRMDNLNKDQC